jgi:HPt (histidine-containing phosphotransfer) domain-containing protein
MIMNKTSIYLENLDKILSKDQALIFLTCESFLKHSKNYMCLINEAHKNKNGQELKRIAHSFKSSFVMFGDMEAQNAAKELERIGQENDWEKSDMAVEKFNNLLNSAQTALRQILEDSPA